MRGLEALEVLSESVMLKLRFWRWSRPSLGQDIR